MSKSRGQNGIDEFLAEVNGAENAKDDTFNLEESDPLADTPTGTKEKEVEETEEETGTTEEETTEEKPVAYHKDPKLQKFIEKEVGKRIKAITPQAPTPAAPNQASKDENSSDELTDILTEIIGNDTPQKVAAIKKFRQQLGRLEERGAEKALAQIRAQADEEKAAIESNVQALSSAFDSIEEEFDVDLTSGSKTAERERTNFIAFIRRVSPKDENGDVVQYPDLIETYKLFKATQKPATDNKRAKDLVSRSMTRSTEATTAPKGGQTWKDVDRIFSKLNN